MYYRLNCQFHTYQNGDSANGKPLTPLPKDPQAVWWSGKPAAFGLSNVVFAVDQKVTLFDNYPVGGTYAQLYSQRFLDLLAAAGVHFQAIPATLVDRTTKQVCSTNYALFHLLERYPAIDTVRSKPNHIILREDFLQNPRPMFRPDESGSNIFLSAELKAQIDAARITGCIYDSIEKLRTGISFLGPNRQYARAPQEPD